MRRLLLVALIAALAIGLAQSESPEMQQEEDCDPALDPAFIEADYSESSASQSLPPYHVGVAAGNPNNRQPFVSAAQAGLQPPVVDARPPVVIVQQPARRACRKASNSNIKLKNNNAVNEISLPEGADISEYADLINGDVAPSKAKAIASGSSSSKSSGSSSSEKMASLSRGLYGADSSSRPPKKSESSLFSGSFSESGRHESSIGSLSPLSSQSQRQSGNSFGQSQGNSNNNNNGNSNNNNNNGNSNGNNNNNNNNQRSENSLSFSDSHTGSESGTNSLFSNSGSNSNTNSGSALNSNTQQGSVASGSQAAASAQLQKVPFGNAVVGSSVMSVDGASLKRVIDRRTFFLTQKRLFKTSIHFRAGVNSFRLFDYAPSKPNPNDPDNLGGYHDEWKAFPDAWANMLKTLGEVGITLRKDKKIYLHIAGFSSSKYPGRPEHFALSERRATATACYLAAWLRAQGMPNFAFKIGFYGDKYASGQDPLSYAKDRRVDITYALNTESYKNFIPQFHWKGGNTIKKGGHDGGLSEYCSRNANWRRPDFQDSYLSYAGPNAAPAGSSSAAGGSGSSGSAVIDPETFEGVMFGSGSSAVPASQASISASAGSSSLAASISAQQRSSSSAAPVLAGVPSLSSSLSGLPVSSSVASAALPQASSSSLGSGSSLPANSIQAAVSSAGIPSASLPGSSSAAAVAGSSSAQPSGSTTVPTGPRGPLIKLQNSNQAVIQDTPHPPRRSRRGFVIGKGPQSEGSKTVFGSPITGQ